MSWHTSPHITSLKNAIVHVDGDGFFATCEEALHPEYKGKPVITGKERGIAASMNYIAKSRGVKRGMILSEVQKACPDAIIIPSDYESYSLFSKRMFAIMRRFTSRVEEYGIDEGFADLTGLRRSMGMSYVQMAREMKRCIVDELGISISCGLSNSKSLAKLGSRSNKPDGFTYISGRETRRFLDGIQVEDIWGVGKQTAAYMAHLGIYTAGQFIRKPFDYIEKHFTKPHQEMWYELSGEMVWDLSTEDKRKYASISKTKTFTPPSSDREFVYAQLIKNLENACIKARRHNLTAKRIIIFLKKQDFQGESIKAKLSRASCYPSEITKIVHTLFDDIFEKNSLYRSTGAILTHLQENTSIQGSLFDEPVQLEKMERMYKAIDQTSKQFGKHSIHLGASLKAHSFSQHVGERGDTPTRSTQKLKGETKRQRIGIPMLKLN